MSLKFVVWERVNDSIDCFRLGWGGGVWMALLSEKKILLRLNSSNCNIDFLTIDNRLILWYLTPFSSLFQLYRGTQCTYLYFQGASFACTPQNDLSNPLASFPHNYRRNHGQWCGKRMNFLWMTNANPRKEIKVTWIEQGTSKCQILHAADWATGPRR